MASRATSAKSKSKASPASRTGDAFASRITRLRASVKAQGLEHFLVTNPLDVAYLTGFRGGDSYLLIAPKACSIISDFRYQEELEHVSHLAKIIIRKGSMAAEVVATLRDAGVKSCGIQSETMTLAEHASLQKALGRATSLKATSGLVAVMRAVKDAAEVALIKKAAQIQEAALLAVLPKIIPGTSELEIAAMIEAEMKKRGSSAPGFETIVAAQPNGSLPHYRPGTKKVAKGQTVLIDWGAIYQGYHSDMTRVFALASWPRKIAEIYAITLEAQEMAAAALAPGRSTKEIDAIARNHIAKAGYGEYFGHGLGHGLGFNGHEDPRLTHMLAETILVPGQVVTIEPGIYLPGVGGVRIEDDYVITEKGAKNLCTMPKDMKWATLA